MSELPQFSAIQPSQLVTQLDSMLQSNRSNIQQLCEGEISWESFIAPLEAQEEQLSRFWSPVGHLNAVKNNAELREAYNQCLPLLSAYGTELGQNTALFNAYKAIATSAEYNEYDPAQQRLIEQAIRDFQLSGVDLPQDQKQRYKEISEQLSKLTTKFEENLLDTTNAWSKLITDEAELAGIPETAKGMFAQAAEQQGKQGWLILLQIPFYLAVVSYADSRPLREECYRAYSSRASELGSNPEWDNTPLMNEILALRHEKAQLLGFDNYAELSLATKMADRPQQVIDFLNDLAEKSRSAAEQDVAQLRDFATAQGLDTMQAWDVAWLSEKLKQQHFDIDDEQLRPYFAADNVFAGLFGIVKKLFGLRIQAVEGFDKYHDDLRHYQVYDANNELRGAFYLDMYARENKRGGAWMDVCRSRLQHGNDESVADDIPVAYLTCNATPPVGDKPALLTHDEVVTLFHEFGHGLHHMLTRVSWPSVGGINGVEWDAVELPSQFLENWAWEKEALDQFAKHYQSGEVLPAALFDKMLAAKNFQSAMQMLRQVEFSLFDLEMHLNYSPSAGDDYIQDSLNAVRQRVAVLTPPAFNRFQNSFSHIFAGGYAAGYYSYKWAEVLSADAFSAFEEDGVFNTATGQRFMQEVLERGASRPAAEHFLAFRGREPNTEALLRHNGIQ